MRLFFASWPPAGTARALEQWARAAQRACGGRVPRQENLHLTLAFLGEADPDAARAAAAGVRLPGSILRIEQACYWKHNRIVWVGPNETPSELAALAAALGETRPYAAHVTLVRDARAPRMLPALPALDWPVREFVLVGSTLTAAGPSYERLGCYALA